MVTAYLGAIDCVEQIRIANAESIQEAWMCVFVIILMMAIFYAAVWTICRIVRMQRMPLLAKVVFPLLFLGFTKTGGEKVLTERGINLTKCKVDSKNVVLEWETTDERIKPGSKFMVQALREGSGAYETIATTTDLNVVIPRFTLDRTYFWRIITKVGETTVGELNVEKGGTE